MKTLITALLILFASITFAQETTITVFSSSWKNKYGTRGKCETVFVFDTEEMTYQRISNQTVYPLHQITDYDRGKLYGKKYIIFNVYNYNSDVTKVAVYDGYIIEYYGNEPEDSYIIYYVKYSTYN